jgi:predicted  nucleic acid-binding Zn-ribbon protein
MHPREREQLEARLQMLRSTVTEQSTELSAARARIAKLEKQVSKSCTAAYTGDLERECNRLTANNERLSRELDRNRTRTKCIQALTDGDLRWLTRGCSWPITQLAETELQLRSLLTPNEPPEAG